METNSMQKAMDEATELQVSIGRYLQRQRQTKRFSQERLAGLARVHVNTISNIERGLVFPTFPIVLRVCRSLDIKHLDLEKFSDS